MVKAYIRIVGNLSRIFAVLATGLMIAAVVVICEMIIVRYLFRMPTIWQTDFVVFAATGAMFLGAPYVLLRGGHVGVDVIDMIVGEGVRAWLRLAASLLGFSFCVIMLIATWIQFHDAWAGNWRHPSLWSPPLWIPLSALPVSFAMLCLQYVAEILARLKTIAGAEDNTGAGPEVVRPAGAQGRPVFKENT